MATRGFTGRRPGAEEAKRLPPGQSKTEGFPVLSMGPTPRVAPGSWSFSITHGGQRLVRWSWDEFEKLPRTPWRGDIHCVTKWTKLDTPWKGVSVDTILDGVETAAEFVMAFSYGGYTTNLPLEDITGGKAWVAYEFDGQPLHPEHGGPARLLVPHLYFWKSAKWVQGLRLVNENQPGFWESNGYNMYGDPWREQRYWGD